MAESTVSDKLDKVLDEMKKSKEQSFKLPWKVRLQQGKLRRQNNCIAQIIKTNGSIDFKIVPIEDNTIKVGEKFYDARAGNVLKYKRMPVIVIKEWDMLPLSPEVEYEKATKAGTLTAAQKLILTKMKMEAIKPKMSINFGTIVVIAAVLIGGYFLLSYMGYV